jgi:hypothetical protein
MIAMSASELPWSEWRDAVIAEAQRLDSEIETALCDKVYPSGRRCIDDWRQELRDAAFRGDLIEVRRLAKMCRHRIRQELIWYEVARDPGCRIPRTFLPFDEDEHA